MALESVLTYASSNAGDYYPPVYYSPGYYTTYETKDFNCTIVSPFSVVPSVEIKHERCKYCGIKAHEDDKYCDGCGAPL